MSEQEQIRLLKVALLSLWKSRDDVSDRNREQNAAITNAGAVLRNLGAPELILDAYESSQIDEQTGHVYRYGVWESHLVAELKATCILLVDNDE